MQARSAPLHAGSARSELLAIVRAYAHGECAAFAIAAQRIFAQQGHAYKLLQFKAVDHGRTFLHAAVLIKGCLFFDAGGFVRFEDLMNRYRMGPFEDVVTSEQELMAISGCEEDDVVQALAAAQTVIALASACAPVSAAAPNQARPASGLAYQRPRA